MIAGCHALRACALGGLVVLSGFGGWAWAAPPAEEKRIALVIGNSDYPSGELTNPKHDAEDIATLLRTLDFEVIEGKSIDLEKRAMEHAIVEFGERLREAGENGVGLFYYARHAVELRGENFLIPIDAKISKARHVEVEAVSANLVLKKMRQAGNRLNFMILDACRDNPFPLWQRGSKGLAKMDQADGTLIAFATAPGQVAEDGDGRNSPYTAALKTHLATPGVRAVVLFSDVAAAVQRKTDGRQRPWMLSSLAGGFYFKPGLKADIEKQHWRAIVSSMDTEEFRSFLEAFPNGRFAKSAKAKVRNLERKKDNAAPKTPLKTAPVAGTVFDPETQLRWTMKDNGYPISWRGADDYCRALTLGRYTDWRLPMIDELSSLYEEKSGMTMSYPSTHGDIRTPFLLTHDWVWSSTKDGAGFARRFNFSYGWLVSTDLNYMDFGCALCVRGAGG